MTTSTLTWRCRDRTLTLGPRCLIMGILNVTPDSFFDGGRFVDAPRAIARGHQMADEGADILDLGGESSRPGAAPVDAGEELRRILPVVEALSRETRCLISVDTTKAEVARRALRAGAHIVNDITALTGDTRMAEVARDEGAGVVLMHMQGTPRTMQADPRYGDVVAEVAGYLQARVEALVGEGLPLNALAVDPGIGFGKTVEHNVALLGNLSALGALGRPVVIGASRKSFLGRLTGREAADRLLPSLAALALAVREGAHVARVHDVKESCEFAHLLAMFDAAKVPR